VYTHSREPFMGRLRKTAACVAGKQPAEQCRSYRRFPEPLRSIRMAGELVSSSIGVDRDAFTKSPSSSSYSILMLLLIFPPTISFHSWAMIACSSSKFEMSARSSSVSTVSP
jgi:hypothetical protein